MRLPLGSKPQIQSLRLSRFHQRRVDESRTSLAGHAVDGCGEFMPFPTANPSEPTSLKCTACGCHWNFHRHEPEDPLPPNTTPTLDYQPHHRYHTPPLQPMNRGNRSSPNSPSPPSISSSYYPSAPHMMLPLSHGPSGPLPDSNTPISTTPNSISAPLSSNPNGRKRFKTRFTQDQKEKNALVRQASWAENAEKR